MANPPTPPDAPSTARSPGEAAEPKRATERPWVWVLPNRNSVGLFFVLLAMGYAGASQNNTAAYLLGFLTLSLALVSAVHCWRNLQGLTLSAEPILPVFEEEPLPLTLLVRQSLDKPSRAVEVIAAEGGAKEGVERLILNEVQPDQPSRGELVGVAPKRGYYEELSVQLESSYPLGFFTARQRAVVRQGYYVYPRPLGEYPLPLEARTAPSTPAGTQPEGDDFAGVRDWRMGESMRHIDWKAVARGERMMVKQWSGGGAERLVLDWDALPEGMPVETRLRELARWVVMATRLEASFELRLPGGKTVAQGSGEGHFHACLRELARWVG